MSSLRDPPSQHLRISDEYGQLVLPGGSCTESVQTSHLRKKYENIVPASRLARLGLLDLSREWEDWLTLLRSSPHIIRCRFLWLNYRLAVFKRLKPLWNIRDRSPGAWTPGICSRSHDAWTGTPETQGSLKTATVGTCFSDLH